MKIVRIIKLLIILLFILRGNIIKSEEIIYLIDKSGSMNDTVKVNTESGLIEKKTKFEIVRDRIIDYIKGKEGYISSIRLVFFDVNIYLDEEIIPLDNIKKVEEEIKSKFRIIKPEGSTNIWDSLDYVLNNIIIPNKLEKEVIVVLLTDGEHNVKSIKSKDEVIKEYLNYFNKININEIKKDLFIWYYQWEGQDIPKDAKDFIRKIRKSKYIEGKIDHVGPSIKYIYVKVKCDELISMIKPYKKKELIFPLRIYFSSERKRFFIKKNKYLKFKVKLLTKKIDNSKIVLVEGKNNEIYVKFKPKSDLYEKELHLKIENIDKLRVKKEYNIKFKYECINEKAFSPIRIKFIPDSRKINFNFILTKTPYAKIVSKYSPNIINEINLKPGDKYIIPIKIIPTSNAKKVLILYDYKKDIKIKVKSRNIIATKIDDLKVKKILKLNKKKLYVYIKLKLSKNVKENKKIDLKFKFKVKNGNSIYFNFRINTIKGKIKKIGFLGDDPQDKFIEIKPGEWNLIDNLIFEVNKYAFNEKLIIKTSTQPGVNIDIRKEKKIDDREKNNNKNKEEYKEESILGKIFKIPYRNNFVLKVYLKYDPKKIKINKIKSNLNIIEIIPKNNERLINKFNIIKIHKKFIKAPSPYKLFFSLPSDKLLKFDTLVNIKQEKKIILCWNKESIGKILTFNILRSGDFSNNVEIKIKGIKSPFKLTKECKKEFYIECKSLNEGKFNFNIKFKLNTFYNDEINLVCKIFSSYQKVKIKVKNNKIYVKPNKWKELKNYIQIIPNNLASKEKIVFKTDKSSDNIEFKFDNDLDSQKIEIYKNSKHLSFKVCYKWNNKIIPDENTVNIRLNYDKENLKIYDGRRNINNFIKINIIPYGYININYNMENIPIKPGKEKKIGEIDIISITENCINEELIFKFPTNPYINIKIKKLDNSITLDKKNNKLLLNDRALGKYNIIIKYDINYLKTKNKNENLELIFNNNFILFNDKNHNIKNTNKYILPIKFKILKPWIKILKRKKEIKIYMKDKKIIKLSNYIKIKFEKSISSIIKKQIKENTYISIINNKRKYIKVKFYNKKRILSKILLKDYLKNPYIYIIAMNIRRKTFSPKKIKFSLLLKIDNKFVNVSKNNSKLYLTLYIEPLLNPLIIGILGIFTSAGLFVFLFGKNKNELEGEEELGEEEKEEEKLEEIEEKLKEIEEEEKGEG